MKNLLTTLILALLLGTWNTSPAKADFIPGLIVGYLLFSGDDKDKETSEEEAGTPPHGGPGRTGRARRARPHPYDQCLSNSPRIPRNGMSSS